MQEYWVNVYEGYWYQEPAFSKEEAKRITKPTCIYRIHVKMKPPKYDAQKFEELAHAYYEKLLRS